MSEGPTDLYRYFDASGRLLYVGISLSAVARATQHRHTSGWWGEFASMTRQTFPTREAALEAERTAIIAEGPPHNVVHNRKNRLAEPDLSALNDDWVPDLSALTDEPPDYFMLCGGVEYRHDLWDCVEESERGKALAAAAMDRALGRR